MLVVDASVVIAAAIGNRSAAALRGQHLVGPPLLWSEVRSVLHERAWRGDLATADAARARSRIAEMPVERAEPPELDEQAWVVADELGWAKTYDAEYVALARILGCRLLTVDARLRRGAGRLRFVVGPTEL